MKRALTKNWGLKLLAFVFSVLLWIIVMNIEDPVDERTFSGIQVTVTHPEIVTNPGNTYQSYYPVFQQKDCFHIYTAQNANFQGRKPATRKAPVT